MLLFASPSTSVQRMMTFVLFSLLFLVVVVVGEEKTEATLLPKIENDLHPSSSNKVALRGGKDNDFGGASLKRNLQFEFEDAYQLRGSRYELRKVLIEIQTSSVPALAINDLNNIASNVAEIYNGITLEPCVTVIRSYLMAPKDLQQRIKDAVTLYDRGLNTHGRFTILVGVYVERHSTTGNGDSLFSYSDVTGSRASCVVPLATDIKDSLSKSLPVGRPITQILSIQELVSVTEDSTRRLNGADLIDFTTSIELDYNSTQDTLSDSDKDLIALIIKDTYNQMYQGDNTVNDPNYKVFDDVQIIEVNRRRKLYGVLYWIFRIDFGIIGRCTWCSPLDPLQNDIPLLRGRFLLENSFELSSDETQPLYDIQNIVGLVPILATDKDPPAVSIYLNEVESNIEVAVSGNVEITSIKNCKYLLDHLDRGYGFYHDILKSCPRGTTAEKYCNEYYSCYSDWDGIIQAPDTQLIPYDPCCIEHN